MPRFFLSSQHEELLRDLWVRLSMAVLPDGAASVPGVEGELRNSYARVSDKWCVFGFQREDPVSDIRGGGVLCVRLLVYFLTQHESVAAKTLLKQKAEMHSRASIEDMGVSKCYPWAAAGINMTRMLAVAFELVGPAGNRNGSIAAAKKNYWGLVDEFSEVFCIL